MSLTIRAPSAPNNFCWSDVKISAMNRHWLSSASLSQIQARRAAKRRREASDVRNVMIKAPSRRKGSFSLNQFLCLFLKASLAVPLGCSALMLLRGEKTHNLLSVWRAKAYALHMSARLRVENNASSDS